MRGDESDIVDLAEVITRYGKIILANNISSEMTIFRKEYPDSLKYLEVVGGNVQGFCDASCVMGTNRKSSNSKHSAFRDVFEVFVNLMNYGMLEIRSDIRYHSKMTSLEIIDEINLFNDDYSSIIGNQNALLNALLDPFDRFLVEVTGLYQLVICAKKGDDDSMVQLKNSLFDLKFMLKQKRSSYSKTPNKELTSVIIKTDSEQEEKLPMGSVKSNNPKMRTSSLFKEAFEREFEKVKENKPDTSTESPRIPNSRLRKIEEEWRQLGVTGDELAAALQWEKYRNHDDPFGNRQSLKEELEFDCEDFGMEYCSIDYDPSC
jgi:hypothetical protein